MKEGRAPGAGGGAPVPTHFFLGRERERLFQKRTLHLVRADGDNGPLTPCTHANPGLSAGFGNHQPGKGVGEMYVTRRVYGRAQPRAGTRLAPRPAHGERARGLRPFSRPRGAHRVTSAVPRPSLRGLPSSLPERRSSSSCLSGPRRRTEAAHRGGGGAVGPRGRSGAGGSGRRAAPRGQAR